mmetsp:Transcript_17058/g.47627  ORF Transcript_17058/g.47627 Transcript_17058/m.47627 type:complete len:139 (+) Transcript_17058:3-419(+)
MMNLHMSQHRLRESFSEYPVLRSFIHCQLPRFNTSRPGIQWAASASGIKPELWPRSLAGVSKQGGLQELSGGTAFKGLTSLCHSLVFSTSPSQYSTVWHVVAAQKESSVAANHAPSKGQNTSTAEPFAASPCTVSEAP